MLTHPSTILPTWHNLKSFHLNFISQHFSFLWNSLQNRWNFLHILGEWRQKRGKHEAWVACKRTSVKNPTCPHTMFKLFHPQTHPQWPSNHSVRKTVVITACCGANTSKVLEKLLVWELKNRKEKHKSMFKCHQNGILGSAESSQTFLVKNFHFLQQPRITHVTIYVLWIRVLMTDRGFKVASWT